MTVSRAVKHQLAPSGILRAGINLSNFLLVSGSEPDGAPKGISPDIEVAVARIEKLEGGPVREEDLRGALDSREGSADATADNAATSEPKDPIEIDYQLARAVDLLRGLSVFNALISKS